MVLVCKELLKQEKESVIKGYLYLAQFLFYIVCVTAFSFGEWYHTVVLVVQKSY